MKNKIKLFPSAVSALFLSSMLISCGGGSDKETAPAPVGAEAFVAGTHPRFDPVISDIPFNTDLVFAKAAASDGTADVGSPSDTVRATLNGLDGFSTSAFFDVMVDGSVDAATVKPMQTVFLLQLNTGTNDALDPANITGIVTPPTASFDTRVVSLDGGTNNVIRIRPLLPLKSKAKYLVVLTNDIKDSAGKPLTRSWTYNALHDESASILDSLVPVRKAIVGWETLASSFLSAVTPGLTAAAAKEKLVLTYTFTTTDPQTTLVAMAAPRAALASSQIAAGVPAGTAITAVSQLEAAGVLPTPKQRSLKVSAATGIDMGVLSGGKLAGNVGKLYTGFIKLPYYLTAPGDLPFGTFLTRAWQPDRTLFGLVKPGATYPTDVDKTSYNVTYRFPFAAKTSDESVPLQVTLPMSGWVPGYAGSLTCGQVYAVSGYPVVIYVHGITSDRTSGLALAHTLASQCVATVAIDLPMHGVAANNAFVTVLNVEKGTTFPFATIYGADAPHERHFNIAGPGGAPAPMDFATQPTPANNGSGAHFTNLGYLLNTRDNNREAVIDLLNLNASLKGLDTDFVQAQGAKLNLGNVNVVGHSLGGILGSVFTTVNQIAISNEAKIGLSSNLNPVRSLVASVSGTQVAQVLVNSATFAPVINAGLAKAGVNVGTSNYEKFMYAAQSAVDAGDPVNFAQILATLQVPVLLQQVKDDAVIPNSADSAPLTGTTAFARLLGTTQLGLGQTQLGLGYVKLNAGDHGSLLRPTDATTPSLKLTGEMQAQVASFVLGAGKVAVGSQAPTNIDAPAP
jgi:pimeloyl-ACP methyl ester carboxylesterase